VLHNRGARTRFQRRCVRHPVRTNQVSTPDIDPTDTEFVRYPVERALHSEGTLRIAGAAHRGGRYLIGRYRMDQHVVGGQHIRTGERRRRIVSDVDALRRIGALIVKQVTARAEQASVAIVSNLDLPVLVALLQRGEEMLAPVLDPFERLSRYERRSGYRRLFRIDEVFGAKSTADIRRDNTESVLVEIEHTHDHRTQFVRELSRGPEREAAEERIR